MMTSVDFLKYVYFLSKVNRLGNTRIKNIISYFKNEYDFFQSSQNDLRKIEGIDSNISGEIISFRKNKEVYAKEFDSLLRIAGKKSIHIICISDEAYPENLRKVFDAPVLLYYRGRLDKSDKYSLSIVGTRTPTEYGKYNCEKFTEKLSGLGIPLISGFARGVDSIVHSVCIKNNNLTYAVLGSGVDVVYPSENRKLYNEILENGAVISEFPIGAKPDKVNFPKRNRIISGISLGTLVIESGIKGGSLLTAEFAVDQDKEVFSIPGYINSKQSEGTNEIIKRGQAKLVTNIDDIISELEIKLKPILKKDLIEKEEKAVKDLNEIERKIYNMLEYEPIHIDKINETTGLSVSDCLVNLLSLEFKNLVRQTPGKNFIKI